MDTTDPIARTDQASAEIKHVAPILASHFHALCEQGFQRCEALELTRDLQGEMVGGNGDDDG